MSAEHGYLKYTKGCRCDICREGKAAYMRRARSEGRRARSVPEHIGHGLYAYQGFGCRCEVCCEAKSEAHRRQYPYRAARLDARRILSASRP